MSLSLRPRRIDALQRDAEIEGQVRLHVVMWLISSSWGDRLIGHANQGRPGGSEIGNHGRGLCEAVSGRQRLTSCRRVGIKRVAVGWNFRLQQRDCLGTARFAQIVKGEPWSLAGVHRRISLQVRESKVRFAVAAVSGAEQRKQRGVLGDGQDLPIAKGPAFRREIERKYSDFSYKWIGHK